MHNFYGIHNHLIIVEHSVREKSNRKNIFQCKLKDPKLDELRKLGAHLVDGHKDTFKKTYGNLLSIILTKEDTGLILTFAQFYDPTLHCFIFQNFLLDPTLEEFAHILRILIKDQVPYISLDDFPKSALIAQALHLKKEVVESNIRTKGNTRGFHSKFLI